MTTAVLSIGSNMGDSLGYLRAAVRGLGAAVRRVSSVYRTPPWGPVAQDDFLNIAVIVSDDGVDAAGWLERCHELERAARRERVIRWGPRTLDADVVAVWQRRSDARGSGAAGGTDSSPGTAASTRGGASSGTDASRGTDSSSGGDGSIGEIGPTGRDGSIGAVSRTGASSGSASDRPGNDADLGADTDPVLSADPVLTLPHPRAYERGFVLVPWHEIQPGAVLPGHGPVATLLAGLDASDIVRIGNIGNIRDIGKVGGYPGDRGGQQV